MVGIGHKRVWLGERAHRPRSFRRGLIAARPSSSTAALYYWHRNQKRSINIHTLDRQSYFIIILSMRLIRSDRKHSKKFSSRKLCPMKRGNSSASSRGRRLPLAPCNQSIIDTKKRKGQEVLKVDGRVRGAIIP